MHRFLPVALLIVALAASLNFLPVKRFLVYRLVMPVVTDNKSLQDVAYLLHIPLDFTTSCCTEESISKNGDFDESANIAFFNNDPIDYPKTSLAQNLSQTSVDSAVLGTKNSAGEDKWIEVSLKDQKLRAWEGNKIIMEFPVSSGLWYPTPKGDFGIWYKTRSQRMRGGSKELGTYYNLPNVPHNMFFYKGFAIHGAYWHNNFGQPMSHGCVNSPLASVAQLFEWTGPVIQAGKNVARASVDNPGTRVFIH